MSELSRTNILNERVELTGVTWNTGNRLILGPVDTVFAPGRLTGIIGPNGSGKSTLLRLLAGVRKPTTGTVRLGKANLTTMSARVRARKVALLEQHADTDLELTARDVVELGRIPHRARLFTGRADDGDVIDRVMERAAVTDLADQYWPTMSGGERQRTQLARALAQEPSLLLLDEPTNHLDLRHQLEFMRTVRSLGITTIAALHDLDIAAAFCDDIVVLAGGLIRAAGPAESVLTSDLVDQVYGVDTIVERHPIADRLTVVWKDLR